MKWKHLRIHIINLTEVTYIYIHAYIILQMTYGYQDAGDKLINMIMKNIRNSLDCQSWLLELMCQISLCFDMFWVADKTLRCQTRIDFNVQLRILFWFLSLGSFHLLPCAPSWCGTSCYLWSSRDLLQLIPGMWPARLNRRRTHPVTPCAVSCEG